jgi:hypothetical protein
MLLARHVDLQIDKNASEEPNASTFSSEYGGNTLSRTLVPIYKSAQCYNSEIFTAVKASMASGRSNFQPYTLVVNQICLRME